MNYYNEWDSFAAEWLRELIKDGLIPNGVVDNRSIEDVEPRELKEFTQCHFFAGIGGWSRALQLAGWGPDRPVWTGSPPCQSFSTAGKGKGKDDARHLWPVFFNLIRECQPTAVFGEQVAAAIRYGWLDDLQDDFETEGYASGAVVLPAGGIGAYHKRDRLFFTAKRVGNSVSKSSQRRTRSILGAQEEGGRERLENGNLPFRYSDASEVDTAVADPTAQRQRSQKNIAEMERARRGEHGSVEPRATALGNSEYAGSHSSEVGRGIIEASHNDKERKDVSRESERAGRSEIAGNLCLWENPQVVYCRDGKYRPIPAEPALFPLANGIPNRVGILRGAGNAIVPQAAAEIIKAYMEAYR